MRGIQKTLFVAGAVLGLVGCGTSPESTSGVLSVSGPNASSVDAAAILKTCGIRGLNQEKMNWGLQTAIAKITHVAQLQARYRFALKTKGPLTQAVALQLQRQSKADRVSEIAGQIGTGQGTLCSILKLATFDEVTSVQLAEALSPQG